MIEIIGIILYLIVYLLFFQIKSLRDYIMEYEKGYGHRWASSIWLDKLPVWFQGYLLGDGNTFIGGNPPAWFKFIVWNKKENKLRTAVDGWHQLDGLIFMMPHGLIVLLLGIYLAIGWKLIVIGMLLVPFVWYLYFNFVFHIWHMKTNKQWFRIPKWVRWLLGRK